VRPTRSLLDRRFTLLGSALLAVVLTLPALRAGLVGDDYFHRMVLLGRGDWGARPNPTFDLFSFVRESQRAMMMQVGVLPWWCDPNLRIALARPLSALTHRADYALWPDSFALQHLHSLLWFGLGVGLVAALYRRTHGVTAAAGLAALFFAVEDAHAWPAAWVANRNALVCLACGTAVILLHLAWHRSRKRSHLLAALAALAVGLGCGEATLGALAYVAAWQVTEKRESWAARLAPLAPYGVVVVIWRVLYERAGYGTLNSTLYVDPVSDPLRFLAALAERWPLMVAAQWLQAPVDLWLMLPRGQQVAAAVIAAAVAAGLLALLWELLHKERLARFWLLGMGLSLIPPCAAFPMDRLLVFSGIGAFGAMALLLRDVGAWPWQTREGRGWRRRTALVLLGLHVPVAAVLLVGGTAMLPDFGQFFAIGARQSPTGPELANQTLVFVNGNDFPVIYTWVIRKAEGLASVPRRVAQLSSVTTSSVVYREDPQTLLITPQAGFLAHPIDRLLASPRRSFVEGEQIERPDYVAEIRSLTADGRPRQVAFRFRRTLEDPAYRWLHWKSGTLLEFRLPRVGESVTVEKGRLFGSLP
jgi:hypothetical protein